MLKFFCREADVLVASAIIQSGIDVPHANTIFVNRADMFGLAQLYQLRGRVGRSGDQAYAYFLVPDEGQLSEDAQKRLTAIQQFTELGAGFRIAAADMEIRGAGNLLVLQTTFVLHPSRRSRLTPWRNTGSVWTGPGLRRATVRSHAGAASG